MYDDKGNSFNNKDFRFECSAMTSFLAVGLAELGRSEIVRVIRRDTFIITSAKGIKPSKCREWLNNEYRDSKPQVVDFFNKAIELDMSCFEPSDDEIDLGRANSFDEALREFFRSNACCPPHNRCRMFVTARWHRHFMTMASIVGVSHPEVSQWWPRIIGGKYFDPRVANNNRPPSK